MRSRISLAQRYLVAGFFCLLGFSNNARSADQLKRFEYSQGHMGTLFRIILYAPDSNSATRAANAAFERIVYLDRLMSDYKENSELMSVCKNAVDQPVQVSTDLFYILRRSKEISEQTNGAFDITVGPVVQLWRRARRTRELPESTESSQARKLIGYKKVHLDPSRGSVQLDQRGMLLDLGGIAKGYAADEAIAVLRKQHGIHRALVAAGGEIVVSNPPPKTSGWVVAIADLRSSRESLPYALLLRNAGVSTSGDSEQYVEINGIRYSHVIDPRSGVALTGRKSVTVVGPDGATSDALATAVSVLGPNLGLKVIDSTKGTASLVMESTDKGFYIFESKRWRKIPRIEANKSSDRFGN